MSIVTALSMMGGATFAYFSDTGTSTDNTFSAGTVNLTMSNGEGNSNVTENVTASFGSQSPLAPGQCLDPQVLNMRNDGTIAANHVDIASVNSNNGFAQYLRVNALSYYDGSSTVNLLPALSITAGNGNSIKDLQDLASSTSSVLTNLTLTDKGILHPLTMQVCLDESAPTEVQGGSDILNMTVTLRQSPHASD